VAKRRDAHTVAINDLRATAAGIGASWGVSCWQNDCKARIVGFRGEAAALRGANAHLVWHVNGKPTCEDCGAWLNARSSKRCRKGTCDAEAAHKSQYGIPPQLGYDVVHGDEDVPDVQDSETAR
jgi:hypothetical protein